jgi:predicted Zn finger-like uncharacterized protein
MSLATRCTSCGTAFRVVQDQLKVSEGWVRCGRCDVVFNALEGLFDLEREQGSPRGPAADEATGGIVSETPAGSENDRPATGAVEGVARPGHEPDALRSSQASAAAGIEDFTTARGDAFAGGRDAFGGGNDAFVGGGNDALGGSRADALGEGRGDTLGETGTETFTVDAGDSSASAGDAGETSTSARETREGSALAGEPTATSGRPGPSPTARSGASPEPLEHAASLDEEIDAHLFGVRAFRRKTMPGHLSERDRLDFSDARFDSDLLADAADDEDQEEAPPTTRSPELPLESSTPHPEFLRRAESRARWQRPGVRWALGTAALGLLVLLGLQAAHHFRNDVAARWPALEPALARWCAAADCTLEAPHRIDEIAVENTALAKLAGSEAFRLGVTLRSRSKLPLATPWIDLSLTDANGRLVARRAVAAAELQPATRVLQPGTELALHAFLEAANARVTGYTIEIFYP